MEVYDAFISHSSEDKLTARLIRGYLRSHNIHSWFDESETTLSDSVDDQDITDKLNPAIERSRYFLLITSRNSLRSRWVEAEVRRAVELRQQGRHIHLIGVLIEPIPETEKPDWMRSIRQLDISGAYQRVDRLTELRDEIGGSKPTYIGSVEPNFFKQIPFSKLSDNLAKCDGTDLSLWFINAGFTFGHYIAPALAEILARHRNQAFTCRVLLMDSYRLHGNGGGLFSGRRRLQKALDDTIRLSKFLTNEEPHARNVRNTRQELERLAGRHPNFSYDLRLTRRIPAGRMIFVSGIGFYGPYVRDFSADSPLLIFDNNSPFFTMGKAYFDEAYETGRRITPRTRL